MTCTYTNISPLVSLRLSLSWSQPYPMCRSYSACCYAVISPAGVTNGGGVGRDGSLATHPHRQDGAARGALHPPTCYCPPPTCYCPLEGTSKRCACRMWPGVSQGLTPFTPACTCFSCYCCH